MTDTIATALKAEDFLSPIEQRIAAARQELRTVQFLTESGAVWDLLPLIQGEAWAVTRRRKGELPWQCVGKVWLDSDRRLRTEEGWVSTPVTGMRVLQPA